MKMAGKPESEDRRIIEQFFPFVEFLGSVLGENAEIVLHDCQNPDASVIAIHNGYISGRKVGSPGTNLLMRVLKSSDGLDYLDKYYAIGPTGKEFYSFSYFIRNSKGKTIGALCINMDIEPQRDMFNFLGKQYGFFHKMENSNPGFQEMLITTPNDTVQELMQDALKKNNMGDGNMSVEEKKQFVQTLCDLGAFFYKGSVREVAKFLKVAESTVYRYLSEAKVKINQAEA